MKLACLLAVLSLTLFGINVSAQMTFTAGNMKPAGAGTATTASNGIVLDVSTNTNYGFAVSDDLVAATTAKDFYITLICANTAIHYGLISGADNFASASLALIEFDNALVGYFDVYYPGRPARGKTSTSYFPALGETLRWSIRTVNYLVEVIVRDSQGNNIMESPFNPGGLATNEAYQNFRGFDIVMRFGFEVLNCGQAKFCLQTPSQYQASPGNCDGGATTSSSCAAAPTSCANSYLVCSGSTPFVEYQGTACLASCPANTITTSGKLCQTCDSRCSSCVYSNSNFCMGCADNSKLMLNSMCATTCSPYFAYQGKCWYICPPDAPYMSSSTCLKSCPSGKYGSTDNMCVDCTAPCKECSGSATSCTSCDTTAPFLYNTQCFSSCPAAARYAYNFTCYSSCPAAARYAYNGTCYSSCSSVAQYGYNGACYSSCPAAAQYAYNGDCYSSCPAAAQYAYNGTCYATCPNAVPYAYNGACIASCPNAAPYAYNGACLATCPNAAPNLYSGTCYSTCPAAAQYAYNGTCYATCPNAAPYTYNNTCYTNCPSDTAASSNNVCLAIVIASTDSGSASTGLIVGLSVGVPVSSTLLGVTVYYLIKWMKLKTLAKMGKVLPR